VSRVLLDINVLLAPSRRTASSGSSANPGTRVRWPPPRPPTCSSGRPATTWHEFWPCDVSLLDPHAVDRTRVHGPRQVTDAYLLALASARGGRFATFDRSVVLSAVPAATADRLVVI
jgi:hypothetical protein